MLTIAENVSHSTIVCHPFLYCTDMYFRKRRQRSEHGSPLPIPAAAVESGSHIADTHDDTTDGATHLFQDEAGRQFGEIRATSRLR